MFNFIKIYNMNETDQSINNILRWVFDSYLRKNFIEEGGNIFELSIINGFVIFKLPDKLKSIRIPNTEFLKKFNSLWIRLYKFIN